MPYLGIVIRKIDAGFRPKLYGERIRQTALTLLITQINNGHTRELERALDRWHAVELEIFLRVLVVQSELSHAYADLFSCPAMYSMFYIQIIRSPSVADLDGRRL